MNNSLLTVFYPKNHRLSLFSPISSFSLHEIHQFIQMFFLLINHLPPFISKGFTKTKQGFLISSLFYWFLLFPFSLQKCIFCDLFCASVLTHHHFSFLNLFPISPNFCWSISHHHNIFCKFKQNFEKHWIFSESEYLFSKQYWI